MTGRRTLQTAAIAAVLLLAGGASAQTCNDTNVCTANDMCSDGECTGSFQSGGCDDGNACTLNDTCQMDPEFGPFCLGDAPAPVGTSCAGGCGTCQPLAPFPGAPVQCSGDPENNGDPCDDGLDIPCFEGTCQIISAGPVNLAFCSGQPRVCNDTDGNPCTDGCNFQTGQCEVNVGPCFPGCETCNPSNGACEPANVGGGCDDFNVCTPESRCETIDQIGTLCLAGPATGPSPTPTVIPGACVGDCNENGVVVVNELIIGVNIALESADVSECLAFDRNTSGGVEVNELISGVNALLGGCA